MPGIFGNVPGPIQQPNPYAAVGNAFPALPQVQTGASNDVLNELQGNLSPDTLATIQNQGADWAVGSGMPGSGVAQNRELLTAAQTANNEANQGQSNYQKLIGPSSQYLTVSPQTATGIAQTNAVNAAAPNPGEVGLLNLSTEIAGLGFGYAANNLNSGGGMSRGEINSIENNAWADAPTNNLMPASDTGDGSFDTSAVI